MVEAVTGRGWIRIGGGDRGTTVFLIVHETVSSMAGFGELNPTMEETSSLRSDIQGDSFPWTAAC